MERELLSLLAGAERIRLENGLELRLLAAQEVLEARREAADLSRDGTERALCSNACLLSRALEQSGKAVFATGQDVMNGLTPGEIEELAGRWVAFNRGENPSPEDSEERVNALKKAWSTRLTSALNGACSKVLEYFRVRRGPGR